ncbi:Hypothetical_protein [Hexamita inflata]|uniref:Hypothetical_protein n=1 Tax=Hexamita inflata TaxID=28002 RepID=A0AA86RRV8_9EUKA|nr:Hypothetical protein HINF_LOCUS64539 [Hexamita inflata]
MQISKYRLSIPSILKQIWDSDHTELNVNSVDFFTHYNQKLRDHVSFSEDSSVEHPVLSLSQIHMTEPEINEVHKLTTKLSQQKKDLSKMAVKVEHIDEHIGVLERNVAVLDTNERRLLNAISHVKK